MNRITIIVPVYNNALQLPALLDALLGQTRKPWQILCSDDGSTDASLKILQEYAKEDDCIQVITGENKGVSTARNRALLLAEGDYIGFCDADDVPEPDYLQRLSDALIETGTDMACCGFTRIYTATGVQEKLPTGSWQQALTDRDEMARRLLRPDGYTTVLWNKLFRREALTGTNGQLLHFDAELHIVEDGEYLFRSNVRSAVFLKEALYRYMVRTDGAMYGAVTPRKLTEPVARKQIIVWTENMAPDVQALAKMKYQKGIRDLMFHGVIDGDAAKVRHLTRELSIYRRELFLSPALPKKEKFKYHIYYPIIRLNLRRTGKFLMERLSGH